MIEKKNIFNTTNVPKAEFQKYKKEGFLASENFQFERNVYGVIFVVYNVFFLTSLVLFYRIRASNLVAQRGFGLTFFGGIVTYVNAFLSFLPQFMEVSCPLSVYNANILNVLVNLIFFCRTLRLVLQHYYRKSYANDSHTKGGRRDRKLQEITIRNKANRIISGVIIVPTLISFLVTVNLHNKHYNKCKFFEYRDAMLDLKTNNAKELFLMVQIFGGLYTFLSLIMTIVLSFIKDANKYRAKFEMLSTCILILIANIVNIILQVVAAGGNASEQNITNRSRFILTFFEITKGGKMLFVVVSIYMLFTSISLPVIQFYRNKNRKSENAEYEALNN